MAAKRDDWFSVSRQGLAQLMEGREKSFIVRELVQNCWDEPGVTICRVVIVPHETKRGYVWVRVEDDAPEGFHDISHAFTLFAKTRKRKDPDARGRFNLGEKQVLSLASEATIKTTTGTIVFNEDGTRSKSRKHTDKGSVFRGLIKMNKDEMQSCIDCLKTFIRPVLIRTWVNEYELPQRGPTATTEASLTTEYEHEDGSWRRTKRKTTVNVYPVALEQGEVPTLYEMGIPVVELDAGDCFHYDVNQRVPLNQDRDNVSPAYLRDLRAEVMNVVADKIDEIDASEPWAREATNSDRISQAAFEQVIEKRFGDKVASFSVNDPEANHNAASQGYTILSGGAMARGEWTNAKRFNSISAASQVAPTKHPEFSPDGVETAILEDEWTDGMQRVAKLIHDLAPHAIGGDVHIRIVRDKWNRFRGWYGGRTMTMNLVMLGHRFFNEFPENMDDVIDFVVHELAHQIESDHLSEKYHKAVTSIAGTLVKLALEEPVWFNGRK